MVSPVENVSVFGLNYVHTYNVRQKITIRILDSFVHWRTDSTQRGRCEQIALVLGWRWGHCSTSRKVVGSIPGDVIGTFHWHNPSGRTAALGTTQPLIEMSTRYISWSKSGRCVGLTTLPTCREIWEPQTSWKLQGLLYLYFYLLRSCYCNPWRYACWKRWGQVLCLFILLNMIFVFLQQISSLRDLPIWCY